jgi:hypothetical protein
MSRSQTYNLIFNAVGALIGLVVVGYVVYSAFRFETEPSCAHAYPAPHRFSLTSGGGALLSPIELQARAGAREWGITENAKVVPDSGLPGGTALEIGLAGSSAEHTGARAANGVSFRWSPSGVSKAQSACLSYAVWLPADFAFDDGGLLPGIFGGLSAEHAAEAGDETRFGTRLDWEGDGKAHLYVATTGGKFRKPFQRGAALAKERWTRIEQEIVLNTPGQADGRARLWVDGRQVAEAEKLEVRRDEKESIAGVLADIGYLHAPAKPGTLRLSPFDFSWR